MGMDTRTGQIREITEGAPLRSDEVAISEAEKQHLEMVAAVKRMAALDAMRGKPQIVQRPRHETKAQRSQRSAKRK